MWSMTELGKLGVFFGGKGELFSSDYNEQNMHRLRSQSSPRVC